MFSKREEAVIKYVGSRSVTIKDIAYHLIFSSINDEILIGNSVRNIVKKCDFYELPWTLAKYRKNGKMYIKKEKR